MQVTIFQNDIPDDFSIPEGITDIAIDTETMGLKLDRDRLCLVQFSFGDGNAYIVQFKDGNFKAPNLKKLLLDPAICKIFHYARFDILALKKYLGIELTNIFCTKIASRLSRTYTDHHSLKELCRELLNINISKQQQSSNWGADELSVDQKEYAAKDVIYLGALKDILRDRLEKYGRLKIANEVFAFLPTRANLDDIGFENVPIFSHS